MSTPEAMAEIQDSEVDESILGQVPAGFCRANRIFVMRREDGHLVGAVSGAEGILPLQELAASLNLDYRPVMAPTEAILAAINRFYSRAEETGAQSVVDHLKTQDLRSLATEWEKPKDLMELADEGPIIKLLNSVLLQAVKDRASDIHVEPYEKTLEIRFRVDGVLRRILSPPKVIQESLLSRIKIMAAMDIAEKRLTQDGRIRLLIGGRDIDLRVSVVPTASGERAVLRLLDRRQGIMSFDDIGMNIYDVAKFETIIQQPNGIFLVTGPTGSGKTTTLYAALTRLNTEERNIITIEDPVEYQLQGVGQIQVIIC